MRKTKNFSPQKMQITGCWILQLIHFIQNAPHHDGEIILARNAGGWDVPKHPGAMLGDLAPPMCPADQPPTSSPASLRVTTRNSCRFGTMPGRPSASSASTASSSSSSSLPKPEDEALLLPLS